MKTLSPRTYRMTYELWAKSRYLNSKATSKRCFERHSVIVTTSRSEDAAKQQAIELVNQQAAAKFYVEHEIRVTAFDAE